MSDTKLFRRAIKDAGFRQAYRWAPMVFNDKHKDGTTRRLKLWTAEDLFDAPQVAQKELERQLKLKFGNRYLFGQFVQRRCHWTTAVGKSFVVYLLTA